MGADMLGNQINIPLTQLRHLFVTGWRLFSPTCSPAKDGFRAAGDKNNNEILVARLHRASLGTMSAFAYQPLSPRATYLPSMCSSVSCAVWAPPAMLG